MRTSVGPAHRALGTTSGPTHRLPDGIAGDALPVEAGIVPWPIALTPHASDALTARPCPWPACQEILEAAAKRGDLDRELVAQVMTMTTNSPASRMASCELAPQSVLS